MVSQGPGPFRSYSDLCRTSLIYKEEEGLTGVVRDPSKRDCAWQSGQELWVMNRRVGTGSPD